MSDFFKGIPAIRYEGFDTENEFAFQHYDPEQVVLGN